MIMETKKKTFDQVKIGDKAFDCNINEFQGNVLAKGTYKELEDANFGSVISYEEILQEGYLEEKDLTQCVAISQDPNETLEQFTSFIYMYDFDPSSVVCYKKKKRYIFI